ncbi:MAG: isoamylase early set domain-containing protein [Thermodesulfobacteriota bacterium]|nr:isoamylase early set domain-containing protein [Thermodesulfobacteriota bacterium]
MASRKQYLKSKPVCKATFRLPKEAANNANKVVLVGDFNDWSIYATPMRKLKNGSFSAVIDLEPNREYQYRYLIDEIIWENDWDADKYVPSAYGNCDNSVIVT